MARGVTWESTASDESDRILNAELEPEQVDVRRDLEESMRELKAILRRDFLPPPGMR